MRISTRTSITAFPVSCQTIASNNTTNSKEQTKPAYMCWFSFLLMGVLMMCSTFSSGQTVIAGWTFPTTTGGAALILPAECGSGNLYADGTNGSSTWTSGTADYQYFGGTIPSATLCSVTTATGALSPTVGTSLVNNNKSIIFKISTTGFQDLKLNYDTRGTATGFTTHTWDYSTDGTTFINASTITGRNVTTFSPQVVDFAAIPATDNQANVYIRLTVSGGTNATGNNRLDNVKLSATAIYTVTYDGNTNDGGTASVDGSSPYASGATVTVLGPGSLTKTGYTFDHWNTAADNSGTSYAPAATFSITSNTTLFAQWTLIPPVTYTVTYDGNGNDGGSAPVDGASPYNSGATVTVLGAGSLTKTGFTFNGWNTAANGSGTGYAPAATFSIGANTTLYAQWQVIPPVTYTVTYDGNGNDGGSAPVDGASPYNSGATVTVLGAGSLTLTGYTFNGWNTAANGSGTGYAPAATFSIGANTTLYAQWQVIPPVTYTVTYDGNGNDGGSAPVDGASPYNSGATVTVLGAGSLTLTGYTFNGWNTAANGSGTGYAPAATFSIGANTTLYAQWQVIPPVTYTVTYDGNGNDGGSAPVDGASPYNSGATVTVLGAGSLTLTGYTFNGWNTAANGSGTGYAPAATFSIGANTTLYAQWQVIPPVTYTVTYDGNGNDGGSAPVDGASPYNSGATVTVLGAGSLTLTGYTFNGWNTAANGSGTGYAPAATFSIGANTTLYAQWQVIPPVTYTVTYDGNGNDGGSAPVDGASPYNSGATVTVLGAGSLTLTGYTFNGWNTAANGSGTGYAPAATFSIGANTTLYAQWQVIPPVTYTVTYDGNGNDGGSAPVDGASPYNSGATVTVLGAGSLTLTGYTFNGWNTAANGSGTAYAPVATFNITGNTTLYAQWTLIPPTTIDWANLQFPATVTITEGGSVDVYGRVYVGGLTNTTSGQAAGISGWVGYSTSNVNPNGASFTWVPATFNVETDGGANDEYKATIGASLAPGTYYYATRFQVNGGAYAYGGTNDYFWDGGAHQNGVLTVDPAIGYANLQFPASATITEGGSADVYGRVYVAGLTNTTTGQAPGITAWVGYSSTDVNPNNGSFTWVPATFNAETDGGANDEYKATIGASLTAGTYYYATRFQVNGSSYYYGGTNFGFWNGTTHLNGVLTINVVPPTTYTVSYDGNGNDGGSAPVDGASPYNSGSTVTVMGAGTLTLTGYTFSGWNTAANGSGTAYAPAATFSITSDVTLYAHWTINTYTLTYSAGTGGSISGTNPQTVNYGANGTAVSADANAGYHFVDWSDASTSNPRTDMNVAGNISVTANFATDCTSPPTVAPITGTTTLCAGSTSQLSDLTPGGEWSSDNAGIASVGVSGLVTANAVGSTTIHYAVTNLCGTTTVDAIVTVTANPIIITSVTENANLLNVLGSGGVTTFPAGCTYLWNTSETSNYIKNKAPGTYTVTITAPNGCVKTKSITIN